MNTILIIVLILIVGRRFADLALQRFLGLLSQRRIGAGGVDRCYPAGDWPTLITRSGLRDSRD